jgi:hypothetical protein
MMKKILFTITILAVFTTLLFGCTKSVPQSSLAPSSSPGPSISGSPSTLPPSLAAKPSPGTTLNSTPPPVGQGDLSGVSPTALQSELPLKVTQPVDASTLLSDTVVVKGQTQPGAAVNVNDQMDVADALGNFSVTITLEEGPNAIDVISIDEGGRQGEVLLLVNVALSQSSAFPGANTPNSTIDGQGNLSLKVTSPIDGATLVSALVTVSGQTAPGATVFVDDQSTIADTNGNFSLPVDLNSGSNAIDVVAIDDNGNSGEVLLMVNAG